MFKSKWNVALRIHPTTWFLFPMWDGSEGPGFTVRWLFLGLVVGKFKADFGEPI